MACSAEVTFPFGLMTFFVTLICARLLFPQGIFSHPFSWFASRSAMRIRRREATRMEIPGITAHVSDGAGYWQGTLVDASESGFCLSMHQGVPFSSSGIRLGVLLERDGHCLPVRVELKWTREEQERTCLGLAIDDQQWSWEKFRDRICLLACADEGGTHGNG
jgi:hypothetical protein